MKTNELILRDHPFLRGLNIAQLQELAECAMGRHFEAGDIIFREGDPANRFYLIQKGKVEVAWRDQNDEPLPVEYIGPGEVLGWSWLFPPFHTHFEARAVEPTDAVFLYGARLREIADRDHDFGYELMGRAAGVMLQRLQAAHREVLALRQELAAAGGKPAPRWNEFRCLA